MADAPTATLERRSGSPPDAGAILNALAKPVFLIDGRDHFTYLNHAGEQFFEASAQSLVGRPLSDSLPADSPVFALIEQVRQGGHSVTEFGITIEKLAVLFKRGKLTKQRAGSFQIGASAGRVWALRQRDLRPIEGQTLDPIQCRFALSPKRADGGLGKRPFPATG